MKILGVTAALIDGLAAAGSHAISSGRRAFTICTAVPARTGVTSVNYDFAELLERGEGAV